MKKLSVIALLAVAAAFVFGLVQLFNLRFEAGDIYPEYSSLRADPLGAKALYESLDRLISSRRHYQPLAKLGDGRGATLFYLGAEYRDLRFVPDAFKQFESFVADGGRLVISIFPTFQKPPTNWFVQRAMQKQAGKPPVPGNKPPAKRGKIPIDDEFADFRTVPITQHWGFEFDHAPLSKDDNGSYEPAAAYRKDSASPPKSITCHTALYFDKLDKPWRVIYAREKDRAVVIERKFGDGSIVLLADSYYFSNEALRKSRQPDLLAWLVGSSQRVIFEETHLGVQEEPGVATLARKYRLHGLFAGLLLLAALFVWKNSVSFMPAYEDEAARERGDLVTGKESAAGFVNLLRRNIRSAELLAACISEWKKSCAHATPMGKLQQVQAVIDSENAKPVKERDPITMYREFCQILARARVGRKT